MSTLTTFERLPLGARFRYPDSQQVWTVLDQWREKGEMYGKIAQWEPDMLKHGAWFGQKICSHDPKEGEVVEAID